MTKLSTMETMCQYLFIYFKKKEKKRKKNNDNISALTAAMVVTLIFSSWPRSARGRLRCCHCHFVVGMVVVTTTHCRCRCSGSRLHHFAVVVAIAIPIAAPSSCRGLVAVVLASSPLCSHGRRRLHRRRGHGRRTPCAHSGEDTDGDRVIERLYHLPRR